MGDRALISVTAAFYGGPLDGHSQNYEGITVIDKDLSFQSDHDPGVLALYRLAAIHTTWPLRLDYRYEGTIAASAA